MAAGKDLGVERKAARCCVGCADRVGGAQRETVHIGAVERRHVDRRRHVVRQHAAEGIGERNGFGGKRRKIELLLEPRLRLLGRDDFEELLLPRGRAHRIEQGDGGVHGFIHGNARISSCAPAAKPSLSGGTMTQPSARAIACIGQCPEASGSTPSATRRTGTTSANADGRDDLAHECHRHAGSDVARAGRARARVHRRRRETRPAPHRAGRAATAPADPARDPRAARLARATIPKP